MEHENLIAALKIDIPQALEKCPKCGFSVQATIILVEGVGCDRGITYTILRECLDCNFKEQL